jgi:hypothetical protein
MKLAAIENPRSRQEELAQFLTATPVADFMASMFGSLPRRVRLLYEGAGGVETSNLDRALRRRRNASSSRRLARN